MDRYRRLGPFTATLRFAILVLGVVVLGAFHLPVTDSPPARPGSLDSTFGTGGRVTTDFDASFDQANALEVQPDEKLVVAGLRGLPVFQTVSQDFALARYNSDGTLDTTFGTGGRVSTDIRDVHGNDQAHALVHQPDGKLVAAGVAFNNEGTDGQFALARYNRDGSLDTTFGTDGKVTTDFRDHDVATALVIQPDGKLVAAGHTTTVLQTPWDFALARYNPDGTLDTTFGADGRVVTDFAGALDQAHALVLQHDGRLVAAGLAGNAPTVDFALARYNPDGSLDASFGTGGLVTTDFNDGIDEANALALLHDGTLVAAGSATTTADFASDFALARYHTDGSLDPGFGTQGRVTTDFAGSNADEANALVVQRDGRLLAVGTAIVEPSFDFALASYRPNGTLDKPFGSRGTVTTDFAGSFDQANAVALQRDGKPVAAGIAATSPTNTDFALARYQTSRHPH
jgi:uncharacterized delta-60 repeat protein